jgi:hypothetical protein
MSDHNNRPADLADEPTTYQTPEWETRSRPRRSFLSRFLPSGDNNNNHHQVDQVSSSEKGTAAAPPPSVLPTVATRGAGPPPPATTPLPAAPHTDDRYNQQHLHDSSHVAGLSASKGSKGSSSSPSMRERFDALLPPNRTYVGGRSRRFLVLFVILPLAVLLLLVLPLAIGLGLGLSHRSSSSSSQDDLPLPSNADTFTGDITYYNPGLGACGVVSSPDDAICAVSQIVFDAASTSSNPNTNPLCGRRIRITRDYAELASGAGNRSVDVTVVDRCTGCAQTDLDLTTSVFDQLAPAASGRVVASWAWL